MCVWHTRGGDRVRERAFAFFSIEVNVRAYDQTLISLVLSASLFSLSVLLWLSVFTQTRINSVARSSWIQPWLLSSTSTSALSHSYDITARCFAHRLRCRLVSEFLAPFLWLKGQFFKLYFISTLFFVTPTISAPSLYFHPPCSSNFYIPLPLPSPHPNALTFLQILPLLISPFIPASIFI